MEYTNNSNRWVSADDRRNELLTIITTILTKRLSAVEDHALDIGKMLNAVILLLTSTNKTILRISDRLEEHSILEEKVHKLTEQVLSLSQALNIVTEVVQKREV